MVSWAGAAGRSVVRWRGGVAATRGAACAFLSSALTDEVLSGALLRSRVVAGAPPLARVHWVSKRCEGGSESRCDGRGTPPAAECCTAEAPAELRETSSTAVSSLEHRRQPCFSLIRANRG